MVDLVPDTKPVQLTPDKPAAQPVELTPDLKMDENQAASASPKGYLANAAKSFTDYLPTEAKIAGGHLNAMVDAFDAISQPGLLNKAMAGLSAVGQGMGYLASPFEAAAKTFVGDPLERNLKPALGDKISGFGSYTAGLMTDAAMLFMPPGEIVKIGEKASKLPLVKGTQGALSPTSLSKEAGLTGQTLSVMMARQARWKQQAEAALSQFQKALSTMPVRDQLQLLDDIETGRVKGGAHSWGPHIEEYAKTREKLFATRIARIQSLGKGQLSNPIENYVAHYWKSTSRLRELEANPDFQRWITSKKTYEGPKSFLRHRTIATIKEGIERWGLEPVTTNPIDLDMMKLVEMDKYYAAARAFNELKEQGVVKYFKSAKSAPANFKTLTDKMFKLVRPASVKVTAGFDKIFMDGIKKLGGKLGFKFVTNAPDLRAIEPRIGERTEAFARSSDMLAATKFAAPDFALAHEFGHLLDYKYNLRGIFGQDQRVWLELQNLADLRSSTPGIAPGYQAYLRNPYERIANFIHGYLYSPETTSQVAPNAMRLFERFIAQHPELKEIKDIKPGFELDHAEARFLNKKEWVPNGEYMAPAEAAKILNNYSDIGLRESNWFQAARKSGNLLNMAQLSLSGFHAIFALNDTMTSKLALALHQAAHGQFGSALKHLGEWPVSAVTTLKRGWELGKAYKADKVLDPEMRHIVESVVNGGGRTRMEEFFQATASGSFVRSFKNGTFTHELTQMFKDSPWTAPIKLISRTLETAMAPIMEGIVPNAKLGVFYDMSKAWLERNPSATSLEVRAAMQNIWDSVDNRLGQMVYDNIHWSKTQKDMAFVLVRSVGWNIGTVRELGGALVDTANAGRKLLAKEEADFSIRMAYGAALAIQGAIVGSIMHYLMTGRSPETITDYYFPETGRLLPNGVPERLNIPGYVKDVVEFNQAPLRTVANKLHPLLSLGAQWFENRDYSGGLIYNPDDTFSQELNDWLHYAEGEFTPFSIRNVQRRGRESEMPLGEKVLSGLGFQRAPSYVADPEKAQRLERLHNRTALRKLLRERAQRNREE